MPAVAIKSTAYCLNHVPEIAFFYGNTPFLEHQNHEESEFLKKLLSKRLSFEEATAYPPNQVYIGSLSVEELMNIPHPWYANLLSNASRFGKYGEIMPEDEFIGLMDLCDVFDLIWLEKFFAGNILRKLSNHPLMTSSMLERLESGHDPLEIRTEISARGALPLYFEGEIIGCVRKGHEIDECLSPYVLLENIACKAGGVLALLHLIKNAGILPEEVDYILECSEEAAGDMNQRGGGNFAKSIAEIAGCTHASGCDIRSFCAGPVNALIIGGSLVASKIRSNCAILAGGAVPKLYMNSRDHVRKELPALEDCLGNFAILLTPENGKDPVLRLDSVGKHECGAGSSPQAITNALVYEPLSRLGLSFHDVDRYAAELHNPEITLPAGAGDVPLANAKMIAALAVMKQELSRSEIDTFVAQHGVPGFAPTQGHIPSGVPYIGHALDLIREKRINKAMIIGKGSLFLARLTNLSDGASCIIETPREIETLSPMVTKEEIKKALLEVLLEVSEKLKGRETP